MFPYVSAEQLMQLCRALCYHPDGGGGYTFTRADFMQMGMGEIVSHVEWLNEQRDEERRAVERARKKR